MEKSDVFAALYEVLCEENNKSVRVLKKRLREILVRFCQDELSDCKENFGSLFFQIDYVCRLRNLSSTYKFRLQSVRLHTGRYKHCDVSVLMSDARSLADCYAFVHKIQIPIELDTLLPMPAPIPEMRLQDEFLHYLRCVVTEVKTSSFLVEIDGFPSDSCLYEVDTSGPEWDYLQKIIKVGAEINLLDAMKDADNGRLLHPGFVVFQPDYLVDISSLAACFTECSNHPLLFLLNKLKRKPMSQAILLGNFAGAALDDIIHSEDAYDYRQTVISNFREKALDYSTCVQFNANSFLLNASQQTANIEEMVKTLFATYDKDKAVLEPSFVCEALGVLGRVDLMTTDFKLLVEQKSGKNFFLENSFKQTNQMPEAHFVQLLLYFGVLRQNFGVKIKDVDAKLLYSKYQASKGLVNVGFVHQAMSEVLKLRNQIVATAFCIADLGFEKLLPSLRPEKLRNRQGNDNFYQNYVLTEWVKVISPLNMMTPLEHAYFCRFMTFLYKENIIGKIGRFEAETNGVSDLWNLPLSKKQETGNILLGLRIIDKKKSGVGNGFDTLTLQIPDQSDDFLPNFRVGDMVYFYSYDVSAEPDVRKSLLYSAYLTKLTPDEAEIRLGDGQQNPGVFECYSDVFCIEHATSDAVSNSGVRSLMEFVSAPSSRKSLLLNSRAPVADKSLWLTKSYSPDLDDILLKVKQAKDYFLLVGPPGTGKTHCAIRYIVEEELKNPDANILLLAYTNRAVDELCAMLLEDIGVEFLRLGRAYGCDSRFRPYLLYSLMERSGAKLDSLKSAIAGKRIFVSTVATLQTRPNIFLLKHFSLAVIDEASQILEHDIVGVLGAHHQSPDKCDIDKFVMVGDYKQLPAIVAQSPNESAIDNLELKNAGFVNCRDSLFKRLIFQERKAERTDFLGVLRKQGRMHPDIADFPNRMFYKKENLIPVPLEHQMETELKYPAAEVNDEYDKLIVSKRLLFFPSKLCADASLTDKVNKNEAQLVALLSVKIAMFYGADFDANKSLGVIVPYRNQIALIMKEIQSLVSQKREEGFDIPDLSRISIDTVERYQGSQRDVIIYSFTIQYLYQLDFITSNNFLDRDGNDLCEIDPKLNVAMTRAKKQLIMTGNPDILSNNVIFRELLEYMKEKGGYQVM